MIILVKAGWVAMSTAEAGVRAPIGQAVASPKIIDGGDFKVCKLSQVLVVLG